MSKVALLIGAKPALNYVGHEVYVPSGTWKVTDNCVDSTYAVVSGIPELENKKTFKPTDLIDGPILVYVVLTSKGTEPFLNIHLDQIR